MIGRSYRLSQSALPSRGWKTYGDDWSIAPIRNGSILLIIGVALVRPLGHDTAYYRVIHEGRVRLIQQWVFDGTYEFELLGGP